MDIEVAPDLTLSNHTIKEVIRKKTEHLNWNINLDDVEPRVKFKNVAYGHDGKYLTIEFSIKNPIDLNETQTLRVFVKAWMFENTNRQLSFAHSLGLFAREVDVYYEVFSKILQPDDEDIVPKFYESDKGMIIVLEDMESKGYVRPKKMQVLDYQHCIVTLKALARIHGRAIIYQELETAHILLGRSFKYPTGQELLLENPDNFLRHYFILAGERLSKSFKFIPELQSLNHEKFAVEFCDMVSKVFETISEEEFCRIRVLCHSDLAVTNLMFRYNEQNEPEVCCFSDFQYAKYSSLAYELWSFFYTCTSQELRNKEKEMFCKTYYESLAEILNENQVYANNVLPYAEFNDMMFSHRIHGLIQGILTLYLELDFEMKSKCKEKYPELWEKMWRSTAHLDGEEFKEVQLYKERIVEEIIEAYYMIQIFLLRQSV